MYNRYIPRGDGTFRRKTMPDNVPEPTPPVPPVPPPPPPAQPQAKPVLRPRPQPQRSRPPEAVPMGTFLRQLLPRDFTTEDLMVVLLLLLMAADCRENPNWALLTLLLYLFL